MTMKSTQLSAAISVLCILFAILPSSVLCDGEGNGGDISEDILSPGGNDLNRGFENRNIADGDTDTGDSNVKKMSKSELEQLLATMESNGFEKAMDLIARGELELDDEKMDVLRKYMESHEGMLTNEAEELSKLGSSHSFVDHFSEIHSVKEFDTADARANLTALVTFLESEAKFRDSNSNDNNNNNDNNNDNDKNSPNSVNVKFDSSKEFDLDERIRRHYSLDPDVLVSDLDAEGKISVAKEMERLTELMNDRHKGDIEELERLEAEYEKMLSESETGEVHEDDWGADPENAIDREALEHLKDPTQKDEEGYFEGDDVGEKPGESGEPFHAEL